MEIFFLQYISSVWCPVTSVYLIVHCIFNQKRITERIELGGGGETMFMLFMQHIQGNVNRYDRRRDKEKSRRE
jgi:hypothetical protein